MGYDRCFRGGWNLVVRRARNSPQKARTFSLCGTLNEVLGKEEQTLKQASSRSLQKEFSSLHTRRCSLVIFLVFFVCCRAILWEMQRGFFSGFFWTHAQNASQKISGNVWTQCFLISPVSRKSAWKTTDSKMWNWRGMPTILGVNVLGGPEGLEKHGRKFAEKFTDEFAEKVVGDQTKNFTLYLRKVTSIPNPDTFAKGLRYTSHFYRDTFAKYALCLSESCIYIYIHTTTNLYHDTAPSCIATLLQKY